MKKMNKKGFTLIEIIGATVIIGVIAIIAFATYTSSLRGFRENYYTGLIRTLNKSGEEFFSDNRNYRPSKVLLAKDVSIGTLQDQNYVNKVVDYNGDACLSRSYVMVIKTGKDKYEYHTCLICEGDGYDNTVEDEYCDRTWLDPTKVDYGLGDPTTAYIYKGTTKEEVRKKLELPVSYVRYNAQGEVVRTIEGVGEGEPVILPSNIDVVNTEVEGDYQVQYEYRGKTKNRTVKVYENSKPNLVLKKEQKVIKDLTGAVKTEETNYTSGQWAQNVIVTLTSPSPTESEVRIVKYQWNVDNRWQDFCGEGIGSCERKKIVREMNQTIRFRSVDSNGKIGKETEPITIKIDKTAPTCTLSIPTPKADNDWYNTAVTINSTLINEKTTDDLTVVSNIKQYNIQEATTQLDRTKRVNQVVHNVLTTPTTANNKDASYIKYVGYVEDEAENFTICETSFKRDSVKPVCEIINHATIKCTDSIAKVNRWYYEKTNTSTGTYTTITPPVATTNINATNKVTTSGTYYLYAKDEAGNISALKNYTYYDVTYNKNGGTTNPTKASDIIRSGNKADLTPTCTKNGFKFLGWSTNANSPSGSGEVKITGHTTLYAIYGDCGTGYYSNNSTTCTQCPPNYQDGFNGTSESECRMNIKAGKRVVNPRENQQNCAAGTFSVARTIKYGETSGCTNCVANSYSNAGAGSCTPCSGGTTSSAGSSSCGSNCSNNNGGVNVWTAATWNSNNTVSNSCIITSCKAGYYKSGNSCVKCVAGSYSSAGATACTVCANGKTNSAGSSSCGSNCSNAAGVNAWTTPTWNSSNNTVSNSCTISTCSAGYYKSGNSCVKCVAGSYSSAGATACTACSGGKTSSAGSSSCGSNCNNNNAGVYAWSTATWNTNNTVSNSCTISTCKSGYYKSGNSCVACAAGTTTNNNNTASSCSTCSNATGVATWSSGCTISTCSAGYYKSGNSCVKCAAGSYSSAGATACTVCANGKTNSAGSSSCGSNCSNAAGVNAWTTPTWNSSNNTVSNSCTISTCSAGYYKSGNSCVKCVAGSYSAAGSTACTACNSGKTSGAGSSSCGSNCSNKNDGVNAWSTATWNTNNTVSNSCTISSCKAGYYKNGNSCVKCPAGTYNNTAGATSCTTCPTGHISGEGATTCSACGGGKYTTDHKSCGNISAGCYGTNGGNSCPTSCVAGSYSATGSSGCTACNSGKTSSAGSSSCGSNCSNKNDGVNAWSTATWNSNNTVSNLCTIASCKAGYYKDGNTCKKCADGFNSTAGSTSCYDSQKPTANQWSQMCLKNTLANQTSATFTVCNVGSDNVGVTKMTYWTNCDLTQREVSVSDGCATITTSPCNYDGTKPGLLYYTISDKQGNTTTPLPATYYGAYLIIANIYNQMLWPNGTCASNDSNNIGAWISSDVNLIGLCYNQKVLATTALNQTSSSMSNATYVSRAYRAFLGREADSSGYSGHLEMLNNGTLSREGLMERLLSAPEARNMRIGWGCACNADFLGTGS